MKSSFILKVICFYVFLISGVTIDNGNAQEKNYIHIQNYEDLKEYFHYEKTKPVIISGHRGGMAPGFPENSIEAMENTLSYFPSFFEIDPRETKDGVLILMHDETLDRTTNLKGKVSDYTYDEIKDARLVDRDGNLTDYRIPRFKDVLEWGRNKTIFNLDNKGISWDKYVELIKDGQYANIALSVRSIEEAMYYYERLDEVMFIMAIFNEKDLKDFEETGIPFERLIAYVGYTMDQKYEEMYERIRSKGSMLFISIHPTQDKHNTESERIKGYIEELMKKPDIIETDYPYLFTK